MEKKSKLGKKTSKMISIAASFGRNRLPYNLLSDKLFNKSMDSSHEESIALYIAE